MSFPARLSFRLWLLVPLSALVFLAWVHGTRARRVQEISALPGWSIDTPAADAQSTTGYAHGARQLIAPEHSNESYAWIIETQQMLATGDWRVRHVDFDNAPAGRPTTQAAPYRWWLAGLAWISGTITGGSIAREVERAALWADPALHLLLVAGGVVFVARKFGALAAGLFAAGAVSLFPLAGTFVAGAPGIEGLSVSCAIGSALLLLAGLREPAAARRWFAFAGGASGFGVWIAPGTHAPLVAGVFLGGVVAGLWARDGGRPQLPWRAWGMAGAAVSALGYVLEFSPQAWSGQVETNHPWLAVAWLGGAELLARLSPANGAGKPRTPRDWIIVACSLAAVASLPVALAQTSGATFLAPDSGATRLSLLAAATAPDSWTWLRLSGAGGERLAALLSLAVLLPLVLRIRTRETAGPWCVLLGLAVAALGLAGVQLRAWGQFQGLALVCVVALTAKPAGEKSTLGCVAIWTLGAALPIVTGIALLIPKERGTARETLSEPEISACVERDLAQWLARRSGGERTTVFAPPDLTVSLGFHGGLRGIGTLFAGNKDGIPAAIRIASATTSDEALALLQKRGVRYVVLPTWDRFLEQFVQLGRKAELGTASAEKAFLVKLARWDLPPWLHPVAYPLPAIDGFQNQSVAVFEVGEEQDEATAVSRLADYLVETGRLDEAQALGPRIDAFGGHLGALTARAQLAAARNDSAGFGRALDALLPLLARHADRGLPVDRRIALATILAQGKRADLAKGQLTRSLEELDHEQLTTLSPVAIYRLRKLSRGLQVAWPEPKLMNQATALLPPGLRESP